MEIRISNKDIHRCKYIRRKVRVKKKDSKEEDKVSFGEIFLNIYVAIINLHIKICRTW